MAYRPNYEHESTLAKAVNNLRWTGHRPKQKYGSITEEMGGMVGSALHKQSSMERMNKLKAAEFAAAQKAREAAFAPIDEDVDYIKGNSPDSPERGPGYERAMVAEGSQLPPMYQTEFEDIHNQLQANEAARSARIGGHYTPQGLETTAREAELNGRDRMRMKAMLQPTDDMFYQEGRDPNQFRMPDYGIGGAPARFGGGYRFGE